MSFINQAHDLVDEAHRGCPVSQWLMSPVSLSNLVDVDHAGVAHEPMSRVMSHPRKACMCNNMRGRVVLNVSR